MTVAQHERARAGSGTIWTIALLLAFLALTVLITVSPVLSIDVDIERAVQSNVAPVLDVLAQAISFVGFPPWSTVIDAVIVLGILLTGHRWAAACAAFAAAGSAGLWFLLLVFVHRPRPTADLVRVTATIPYGSYPSGHVLNLTAFFGFLLFLSLVLLRPGWLRGLLAGVCGLLIAAIGLARIYSGEHWPTDVLAGYIVGALWLRLTMHVYRWGLHRWPA